MKNVILKLATFFVVIGICGFIFYAVAGTKPVYLEDFYAGEFHLYRFNVQNYWKIIADTLSQMDLDFIWGENPLTWQQNYQGDLNLAQFASDLANNMGYIFNIFIMIINTIIFLPIRLGVYLINTIFAVLGVSVNQLGEQDSRLNWLRDFINFMQFNFRIPLIGTGN